MIVIFFLLVAFWQRSSWLDFFDALPAIRQKYTVIPYAFNGLLL